MLERSSDANCNKAEKKLSTNTPKKSLIRDHNYISAAMLPAKQARTSSAQNATYVPPHKSKHQSRFAIALSKAKYK